MALAVDPKTSPVLQHCLQQGTGIDPCPCLKTAPVLQHCSRAQASSLTVIRGDSAARTLHLGCATSLLPGRGCASASGARGGFRMLQDPCIYGPGLANDAT